MWERSLIENSLILTFEITEPETTIDVYPLFTNEWDAEYSFDWGDGTEIINIGIYDIPPAHIYQNPGIYEAKLQGKCIFVTNINQEQIFPLTSNEPLYSSLKKIDIKGKSPVFALGNYNSTYTAHDSNSSIINLFEKAPNLTEISLSKIANNLQTTNSKSTALNFAYFCYKRNITNPIPSNLFKGMKQIFDFHKKL